jgi:hypothetical protein
MESRRWILKEFEFVQRLVGKRYAHEEFYI